MSAISQERAGLAKAIILASSPLRLFSCLYYKLNIRYIDADFTALAYSQLNHNTKKSELGILVSNQFVESLNNANELVYIILHEILHILNEHLSRGMRIPNQELYGIACDHVINTALDADINANKLRGVKSPESRCIINSLVGQNLSAEEVYLHLLQHATTTTQKIKINMSGSPNGDPSNSNSTGDPSDNSEDPSDSNDGGGDQYIEITKTHVKLDDGQEFVFIQDFQANGDAKPSEKSLQDDTRRILNSPLFKNDGKGNTSSKVIELIEEAIKVSIPWDELLENVIKHNITEKSDNKTWARVNKRMYQYKMILPYNDMEETFDTLMIFVDTSGSISTEDLQKFVYVIRSAMYHFKKIIKIDHDCVLFLEQKTVFDSTTIDNFANNTTPIGFSGRGGTSHQEVYDYIESIYRGDDPEQQQLPGLILFVTDFMSDIEGIHHKYEWPKEIPYKYIIASRSEFPVDPKIDPSPIFIPAN